MIGYHVPIKHTFLNSIQEPHQISKIRAFQLFVRNPRQLRIVEFKEIQAKECKEYIHQHHLFLVVHATYLLNSATKENYDTKILSAMNDLLYAEKIGAIGSVFHVGKHLTLSIEEGIENMYQFISEIIQRLQEVKSKAIYILETCASSGTELLCDLQDFGAFYHRFSKQQQQNIKICIDTCHIFASGYSLNTKRDAMVFVKIVQQYIGWNNVCVIHLNDSKKECGSHVDRHENLCKEDDSGFQYFVRYVHRLKIPLILETPHDDHNMYEVYQKDLDKIHQWLV